MRKSLYMEKLSYDDDAGSSTELLSGGDGPHVVRAAGVLHRDVGCAHRRKARVHPERRASSGSRGQI